MAGLTQQQAQQFRAAGQSLGAPLIISPRMGVPTSGASILSGSGPPQMEHPSVIYTTPYDYTNFAALAAGNPLLAEYADHTGGLFAR